MRLEKIKRIKEDIKSINKVGPEISKLELLTAQLTNLATEHAKLLGQIRNQKPPMIEVLLDRMAENETK